MRVLQPARYVHPRERRGHGRHGQRERRDRRLQIEPHGPVAHPVEEEFPNLPRVLNLSRHLLQLAPGRAYAPQVRLQQTHGRLTPRHHLRLAQFALGGVFRAF